MNRDVAFPDAGHGPLPRAMLSGVGMALSGPGLLRKDGRLFGYTVVILLLYVALFVAVVVGVVAAVDALFAYFLPVPEGTGHVGLLQRAAAVLLRIVEVILGFVVAFYTSVALGNVVASPLLDAASARTERILVAPYKAAPDDPRGILRATVDEAVGVVLRLGIAAAGFGFLVALGLVPVVGPMITSVLGFAWASLCLAVELVGPFFSRHQLGTGARCRAAADNPGAFLGFGAVASLLLILPVLLPLLVPAATRLGVSLAVHDRIPSALPRDTCAALRHGSQQPLGGHRVSS